MVGEGLEQRHLIVGEWAGFRPCDVETPEHNAVAQHWYRDLASIAEDASGLDPRRGNVRVGLDIMNLERTALLNSQSRERLPIRRCRIPTRLLLTQFWRYVEQGPDVEKLPIKAVERAVASAAEADGVGHNCLEHRSKVRGGT